jgi:hypothetical protein
MNRRIGARASLVLLSAAVLSLASGGVDATAAQASGNGGTTSCDVTAGPLLAEVVGNDLMIVYTVNNTCFYVQRIRFDSHITEQGRDHLTNWQSFPHGEWTYTQHYGLRTLAPGSYVVSTNARSKGERIGYGDLAFSWAGEG